MHIIKTVSAGIIASSLLLGATACGSDESTVDPSMVQQTVEPRPSSSPKPSAGTAETAPAESAPVVEDNETGAVLSQANAMLALAKDPATMELLSSSMSGEQNNAEVAMMLKETNPELFAVFDVPDEQSTLNALEFLTLMTNMLMVSNNPDITFVEASIDGDTAVATTDVPLTAGMPMEGTEASTGGMPVEMVKRDGTWLISAPSLSDMM